MQGEVNQIEQIRATLVGLAFVDAEKVATDAGWRLRRTEIDGKAAIVTCDYRTDRINVSVVDGIVTEVAGIG